MAFCELGTTTYNCLTDLFDAIVSSVAPLKKSMIYYWLLFCLPVVGLLSPVYLSPRLRLVVYSSFVMLIVLFIGFRHQIGGDWANYLEQFNRIHDEGIRNALNRRSIGYGLVNWISAQIGWGIYGVNVICGTVFVSGLTLFCNRQPVPWLAWIIALPYLVVVVGMGYTAQSVAVGLILYGFVLLEDRRRWGFVVAVGLASVFHKTSIALLPLMLFTVNLDQVRIIVKLVLKRPLPTLIPVALSGLVIIYILWRIFYDDFQILMEYYVERTQWDSHGAFVRLAMNAVPGAALLLFAKKFSNEFRVNPHWYVIASIAVVSPFFAFIATTAFDRVAIYFMVIQIYVWSRIPMIFQNRDASAAITIGIILVYGLVFWVWLNYANHSYNWVPYTSILPMFNWIPYSIPAF